MAVILPFPPPSDSTPLKPAYVTSLPPCSNSLVTRPPLDTLTWAQILQEYAEYSRMHPGQARGIAALVRAELERDDEIRRVAMVGDQRTPV